MAYNVRLKQREKRKLRAVLKLFKEETLKDVDKAIDSGMIDTQELKDRNDYVFAKAIIRNSAKKIAMPDWKDAKQIEKQVGYI